MAITGQDAINDALERFGRLGFTMENSFSEHGPMVAEAISSLGCNEDVAEWVEIYKQKHRHAPLPPRKHTIDEDNEAQWRSALGDYSRGIDWLEFFRKQLQERRWQDLIANWVPILVPGYFGGLTQWLIRTAHAVRRSRRTPIRANSRSTSWHAGSPIGPARTGRFPAIPIAMGTLSLTKRVFVVGIRNFSSAATPVQGTEPTRTLVATRIHGWSRNPIYVGMFLVYAGIGIAVRSPWILILTLPLAITMRYGVVAREEAYLEWRFGDAYRDYKARVRRWL